MYTEETKKELKELKDLYERIKKLEEEKSLYNGESAEPMQHNIDKFQEQYDEKKETLLKRYEITKQELKERFEEKSKKAVEEFLAEKEKLQVPYDKKIKEYDVRIAKLSNDLEMYKNDESYATSLTNNIEKLKAKKEELQNTEGKEIEEILANKEASIKENLKHTEERINNRMEDVRTDLQKAGIEVKKFEVVERTKPNKNPDRPTPSNDTRQDNKPVKKESKARKILRAITAPATKFFKFIGNNAKALGRKMKSIGSGTKKLALNAGKEIVNTNEKIVVKQMLREIEKDENLNDVEKIESKIGILDEENEVVKNSVLKGDYRKAKREEKRNKFKDGIRAKVKNENMGKVKDYDKEETQKEPEEETR